MTRDSWLWWIGIVGAVIVSLATVADPVMYGIPEWAVPYLRLGALIIGIISGKLATSPLPSKEDKLWDAYGVNRRYPPRS